MDLSVPWLFSSLAVSCAGLGLFLYGKKQGRLPQLLSGIVLMAVAGFIASPAWMMASAGAIVGTLWVATRAGQ